MNIKQTLWIGVLALGAACGKKKDDAKTEAKPEATPVSKTVEAKPAAPAGDTLALPFETPKGAEKWQGMWDGRLTLRTSGTMSLAGDPAAIKIEGDKATVWDGKEEKTVGFKIDSPCEAKFILEKDGAKYTFQKTFVVAGDQLQVANATAGYRKGNQAIVCASDGVFIVDDKGGCAVWSHHFGNWESKPSTCKWDGDKLTLGTGDFAPTVTAEGDVLASEQFREEVKQVPFTKVTDWDAAKAKVTADVKAKDPGEIAKAAGGKVGDTTTVAGLAATFAADPTIKGKQVEVTALYLNSNTAVSGSQTSYNAIVVDKKGELKVTLSCATKEEVKGLKQYDKVKVKGTVDESFGTSALADCTITKAK